MSDERPTDPDLRTWGNDALQALSDAFDKVVRSRESSPGIDVPDARAQDWFDLGHLDPDAPGKFPGIGGVGTTGTPAAGHPAEKSAAGSPATEVTDPAPTAAAPAPRPPPRSRSRIPSRRSPSRSCSPSSTP